jgi:hypothetical protein
MGQSDQKTFKKRSKMKNEKFLQGKEFSQSYDLVTFDLLNIPKKILKIELSRRILLLFTQFVNV